MLTANKEKLRSFFISSNQFRIPFFQRAYVWKIDNWKQFWDDILDELKQQTEGNNSEHFIGTIIVKQTDTGQLGSLVYDLIDGQQRLTTVCLLLRALHDASEDEPLKKWIGDFLVFSDSFGEKGIRLIHSKVDRGYFQEIVLSHNDNTDLPTTENKIVQAYKCFKEHIAKDIAPDQIRNIVNIVLEKLPVIHMALSANDDVQQIFDTINSLGVKLTTGELLKNYLFSFSSIEPYYEKYWKNIFEADEDSIIFWETNKTSGRIIRTTIELFLYSYLVIINESNVKLESLFKEFKEYLKKIDDERKLHFAKELSEYAKLYEKLPDGVELSDLSFSNHEKRFFYLVNELDIATVFPLVLFIYKNIEDKVERGKIIGCLESYLVRRTVCKLTTKNYNNLFISIMVDLKKNVTFTADFVLKRLLAFNDETNRFPNNLEFEKCFLESQLINKYSKAILYCIALYQLSHKYTDNSRLSSESLTVEHIMPKKWRNNWPLLEDTKLNENYRDNKLLTLGNLTLIKGRLNSSLRDASWNKKQNGLDPYSMLAMTKNYLKLDIWDEITISERGKELLNDALKIWTVIVPDDYSFEVSTKEKSSKEIDHSHTTKTSTIHSSSTPAVTGTKPIKLTIKGKIFDVSTWKDVLRETLNSQLGEEDEKIKIFIEHSTNLSKNKYGKYRSVAYLNNNIAIETGHSAPTIYNICGEMCNKFGLKSEDWLVEYK